MRPRKMNYIDVFLTKQELRRIKLGNTAHRVVTLSTDRQTSKVGIAIKLTEQKVNRRIAKLEAELRKLKQNKSTSGGGWKWNKEQRKRLSDAMKASYKKRKEK